MSYLTNSNSAEGGSVCRDEVQRKLIGAQEALDREAFRCESIELELAAVQEELRRLESLSAASVFSSLLGTKAGKIDARNEELMVLRREQQDCARRVSELTQTVEQIRAELDGLPAEPTSEAASAGPSGGGGGPRDIERALEAGKVLVNALQGSFGVCNKLRRGPNAFRGAGTILGTAMQAYKNHAASGVTGQIADSVERLAGRISQLDPNEFPDIFAMLPRLEAFADASTLGGAAGADSWAELESVARSIVADLQEGLRRPGM